MRIRNTSRIQTEIRDPGRKPHLLESGASLANLQSIRSFMGDTSRPSCSGLGCNNNMNNMTSSYFSNKRKKSYENSSSQKRYRQIATVPYCTKQCCGMQIHDILVGMDPDPRIRATRLMGRIQLQTMPFSSLTFTTLTKNYFFLSFFDYYFLKVHLHHFSKMIIKKSQTAGIKVFLTIFG
jgi:hypothetical protein